jgi:hypothetical protein
MRVGRDRAQHVLEVLEGESSLLARRCGAQPAARARHRVAHSLVLRRVVEPGELVRLADCREPAVDSRDRARGPLLAGAIVGPRLRGHERGDEQRADRELCGLAAVAQVGLKSAQVCVVGADRRLRPATAHQVGGVLDVGEQLGRQLGGQCRGVARVDRPVLGRDPCWQLSSHGCPFAAGAPAPILAAMRPISILASALAAIALAACGGSDDEGGGGGGGEKPAQQAQAGPDCVAMWNDRASADQRAKASLSHRGDAGEPVIVGRYSGEQFTSTGDGFDEGGSTMSTEIAVSKGDCVAVDLTGNDTEVNWAMVLAKRADGSGSDWYFLSSEKAHPLADPPPAVDGRVDTIINGFGDEAKLTPKP